VTEQVAEPDAAGTTRRLVVGVDGSSGSRAALIWALGAAARSGAAVEVVAVHPVEFSWPDSFLVDPQCMAALRTETGERARKLVDEARREPALAGVPGASDVRVDVTVLGGPVVVHHEGVPRPPVRVVVGVDDSELSRAVLKRAAGEAQRLDARLELVAVMPTSPYWGESYVMTAALAAADRDEVRARAQALADDVLGPRADVRIDVVEGAPTDVLVDRADGAALLVVGGRSRSTLAGTVLGSVALHCAASASCPVMVVHAEPGGLSTEPLSPAASGRPLTAEAVS